MERRCETNDIISAWLAGLSIWGLAMLGLVHGRTARSAGHPDAALSRDHGGGWYAKGFPDEEEAEAIWEYDRDDPSDRRRSTFLPPLPPPGSQQGSNYQQNNQSSRQVTPRSRR